MLEAAGVRSVADAEARENFGIRFNGNLDGIAFPYFINGVRVTCRLRRDNPEKDAEGKPKNKYIAAWGDARHLYLPPGYESLLTDHKVPILFVESEKAVLAIMAWAKRTGERILPIGCGGCWGWRGRIGIRSNANGDRVEEKGALPEVAFAGVGRETAILFDANVNTSGKVKQARSAFEAQLLEQGAKVGKFDLPAMNGVNGPDDFLAIAGDHEFRNLLQGKYSTSNLRTASPTDSGNAELVMERFGGRSLYCKERHEWFLADQTERWSLDRTSRVKQIVQETLLTRWAELSKNPDPRDPRLRQALKSLEHKSIRDCVAILEFQQSLAVLPEQLDRDPLLLGVENGILSLSTGELELPRLDLLVTKCAPVLFDSKAKCNRWIEYLDQVQPNEKTRQFLQRLAGSLLTGLQPEQSLIFFVGVGGNGKSVFVRVFHDLLGPQYAFKARKQLLFIPDRRTGEHAAQPNDIADIAGARLITCNEQVGKHWNFEFIKDYTGGELQHGRQLYHPGKNFKATGKILVSANEEPTLDEFDEAVRRRFVCVPWNVIVPEKQRVAPLELYVSSLLRDGGASGILNWAIDGLRDLIARNWRLDPPAEAVEKTQQYILNEDRIANFFNDWFEDGVVAVPLTTHLLRKYFLAWLDEPEKFVISAKGFTKQCRRIFGERCRQSRTRFFVIDNLRLSERGRTEFAEHQNDLFAKG
jgi:P4 family phage/plasmid primase-like protien